MLRAKIVKEFLYSSTAQRIGMSNTKPLYFRRWNLDIDDFILQRSKVQLFIITWTQIYVNQNACKIWHTYFLNVRIIFNWWLKWLYSYMLKYPYKTSSRLITNIQFLSFCLGNSYIQMNETFNRCLSKMYWMEKEKVWSVWLLRCNISIFVLLGP